MNRMLWFTPSPDAALTPIAHARDTSEDGEKIIIWEKPDGLMGYTVVMEGFCPHEEAECIMVDSSHDEEHMCRGWRKVAVVDRSEMPDGGDPSNSMAKWKAAWEFDGRQFGVSMPRAREVHRDRMRAARRPKLEALDLDYMRAMEGASTKERKAIAARKQALRDVTAMPEIDAAETVEDLESIWPEVLTAT